MPWLLCFSFNIYVLEYRELVWGMSNMFVFPNQTTLGVKLEVQFKHGRLLHDALPETRHLSSTPRKWICWTSDIFLCKIPCPSPFFHSWHEKIILSVAACLPAAFSGTSSTQRSCMDGGEPQDFTWKKWLLKAKLQSLGTMVIQISSVSMFSHFSITPLAI